MSVSEESRANSNLSVVSKDDNFPTDNGVVVRHPDSQEHVENVNVQNNGDDEDINETYYNFQLFLKQVQDNRAEPVVKYTRSFLRNFATQRAVWTASEQEKLLKDFKTFIYSKYKEYEPFKELNKTELRNAKEGMEKLLMGKLYPYTFSPLLRKRLFSAGIEIDTEHKEDLIHDKKFKKMTMKYRFIEPHHLDINFQDPVKVKRFAKFASIELNKMNNFKAPRDKMVCILNSCKIIFGFMKHFRDNGADSFVPLLVYSLITGSIDHLVSNIQYIDRFRYTSLFRGEEKYYLSSLQAAFNFILEMNDEKLTVTDSEEFKKLYQENLDSLKKEQQTQEKEKEDQKQEPTNMIDEMSNMVFNKFNELFIQDEKSTISSTPSSPSKHAKKNTEDDVSALIQDIQAKEHRETVETLTSMFPDLDVEIIEDVCIAKKHRIGPSVDILLSLSN
ncbi:hypothetical protein RNJ44_04469 [Nakaseomyces bracarensis]|uniref:Vacuolar protein sorting-associated protein 9 n=1 Tax=Nakaseomyces bracarensis TaxID=273131 RepID=A0ABR4NV49_9SACH